MTVTNPSGGGATPVGPIRYIGAGGQPAFQNSWTNHNLAPDQQAGFYLDSLGVVHLCGAISGGGNDTTAFTLPAGSRPGNTVIFTGVDNSLANDTTVTIDATGALMPHIGFSPGPGVSLEGLTFAAGL
jgi:hypothetical protein